MLMIDHYFPHHSNNKQKLSMIWLLNELYSDEQSLVRICHFSIYYVQYSAYYALFPLWMKQSYSSDHSVQSWVWMSRHDLLICPIFKNNNDFCIIDNDVCAYGKWKEIISKIPEQSRKFEMDRQSTIAYLLGIGFWRDSTKGKICSQPCCVWKFSA